MKKPRIIELFEEQDRIDHKRKVHIKKFNRYRNINDLYNVLSFYEGKNNKIEIYIQNNTFVTFNNNNSYCKEISITIDDRKKLEKFREKLFNHNTYVISWVEEHDYRSMWDGGDNLHHMKIEKFIFAGTKKERERLYKIMKYRKESGKIKRLRNNASK